jgi:hypothetical protein
MMNQIIGGSEVVAAEALLFVKFSFFEKKRVA